MKNSIENKPHREETINKRHESHGLETINYAKLLSITKKNRREKIQIAPFTNPNTNPKRKSFQNRTFLSSNRTKSHEESQRENRSESQKP
jgi:hypothetical protein